MKIQQLIPAVTQRIQFGLRFRKFVPRETGCYALTTFDNHILYVGLTDSLYRRFNEHWDSKDKRLPNKLGRAFWFYYLTCPEKVLCRIERTWMNQHVELHGVRPILNKVDSPVR